VKCAEGYAETSSLMAAARMKVVAQKCCVFFISSRVKHLSCKLQFGGCSVFQERNHKG
jgi:hypothetical protein